MKPTEMVSKYVPESPTINGYYGATHPRSRGKIGELTEYGTMDINMAPKFDTFEECQAWCEVRNKEMQDNGLAGTFKPYEHGW